MASTTAVVLLSAVDPADPDTLAVDRGDELSSFTMLKKVQNRKVLKGKVGVGKVINDHITDLQNCNWWCSKGLTL